MKRTLQVVTVVLALGAIGAEIAVAASSPGVVTRSAIRVSSSGALLRGTVNPNGASTSYEFQLGLTTAYGTTTHERGAGAGRKPIAVQASATGLIPGTVYHYRLVALSKYGTATGADRTFKTSGHPPPGVLTGPVTALGPSSATLTGTVNPNGETTRYLFQYGPSTFYGMQTTPGAVGGSVAVTVSEQVQALEPGTTFHYRLVGLHGTSIFAYGSDETFVTYPSPRPVPRVLASTRPRRARGKPFAFTTHATIVGPRSMPAAVACQGASVKIRYFFGRREVASSVTPLQPNCQLSSRVVLRHRFGRGKRRHRREHLRVVIHFSGNHYLAPASARRERVTIG